MTLGALLPALLIYEFPGPWAGVELGWRTSAHTRLVANAGLGVVSMQGSQRYLAPVGFSLRASPWKNGPWAQVGLGAMPYVEHIRVALPQRTVSTTDIGAMLTCKVQIGVHLYNWEFALGTDENLLPRPFYKNYKGDETLPWGRTLLVWFGRRL